MSPGHVLALQQTVGNRAVGRALQRKIGFEAEVRRPIFDASAGKLPGDAPLLDHPYFTVVSDSQKGKKPGTRERMPYSNIEIVLKPFDQLPGTLDDALAAMNQRLTAVWRMLELLYPRGPHPEAWSLGDVLTNATAPRPGGPVLPDLGLPRNERGDAIDTRSHMIAPKAVDHVEDNKLFVHYSLGVPPELLSEALTMIATNSRDSAREPIVSKKVGPKKARRTKQVVNQGANFAKQHAQAAPAVAESIARRYAVGLNPLERREFVGHVALLFAHMAAFANMVAAEGEGEMGQPKNYILGLSRAPLRSVFDTLSDPTKRAIEGNAKAIYDALGADTGGVQAKLDRGELPQDQILSDFADEDTRQVRPPVRARPGVRADPGTPLIRLDRYIASGLGLAPAIAQEDVFGGMKEVLPDVSVQGGATTTGRGVVLELRSLGAQRVTPDELAAQLAALIRWSRQHILGHP